MQSTGLSIGRRVRAELSLRGLTAKDLACLFGVTPNTVSRRLRGTTSFTADELAAISTWLGVGVERFFDPIPDQPTVVGS